MRPSHLKSRALLFFCLYVCAIAYLSLYPWQFLPYPRFNTLIWDPLVGRRAILDAILNFFFYVPLGAAAVVAIRRGWVGWIVALCAGCGLSYLIEWLQLWSPLRYGTWTDLMTNSLGTVIGATAASWATYSKQGSARAARTDARRAMSIWNLQPSQALFVAFWALWQAFPFFPAISIARLTQLTVLMPWSWRTAGQAFVGFAVLRVAVGNSPWLWVAYGILPAQQFLINRTLSGAAMIGAALGYAVAQRFNGLMPLILKVALPVLLVFEEFRPFQITNVKHPFICAPFNSWFAIGDSAYYPVLFGKLYLYTASVWSLRTSRWYWKFAIGLPALILLVGEWTQQYLPGRTPETTDVVLLGIGAILLWIFSGERQDRAERR